MVSTNKVEKKPYELWYGKPPKLSYLKVWGCEAYVRRDTQNKLESRSLKWIFGEYPKETRGYHLCDLKENKVFVPRNVGFLENNLISQEINGSHVDLEKVHETNGATPSSKTTQPRSEPEHQTVGQERALHLHSADPVEFLVNLKDTVFSLNMRDVI